VTVVDVGTVERQDHAQLFEKTGAGCFDTQHTKNLDERVAVRLCSVDSIDGKNICQGGTGCIQDPFVATWVVLRQNQRAVIVLGNNLEITNESTLDTTDAS